MRTTTEPGVFDNLVQVPTSPAEISADVLRAIGLLSVALALGIVGGTAIPLFALVLLGQLLPRFLGVRPALDITIGVVLLVAGWSNPLELYRGIPNWDLVVHFAANGLIAVIAYLLYSQVISFGTAVGPRASASDSYPAFSRAPSPEFSRAGAALLTTCFGMSAGVVWELGEWFGHTFIDSAIVVEYNDTLGDLAIGALGSLVAGLAMPFLIRKQRSASE
jgi:hypothetical protein